MLNALFVWFFCVCADFFSIYIINIIIGINEGVLYEWMTINYSILNYQINFMLKAFKL